MVGFLVALGVSAAAVLVRGAESPAAGMCGRSATYASPTGDDAGEGTIEDPYKTLQRLVERTPRYGVACLRAGDYEISDSTLAIARPMSLTSYPGLDSNEPGVPGGSEDVEITGRIAVDPGAEGTTITGLKLVGQSSVTNPAIFASRTTLRGNDITNGDSDDICVVVNRYHRDRPPFGVRIENNKIHNCGIPDDVNPDHAQFDQAVYIVDSKNVRITGNWIYDNAARGIQLYPHALGSVVTGNVIDGNGEGLLFGGEDENVSSGNLVQDNVISNSTVRWNVEAHWAHHDRGEVGEFNVVTNNCVYPSNSTGEAAFYNSNGGIDARNHRHSSLVGYSVSAATVADPQYLDREAEDFNLGAGSPCTHDALEGSEPWSAVKCVQSAYPSTSSFIGTGGVDVLAGTKDPDYVAGGTGRDTLDGGDGGDCMRGAGGLDSLLGGPGSDRIFGGEDGGAILAADGVADEVSCGGGASDHALVDVQDTVSGCEVASYP